MGLSLIQPNVLSQSAPTVSVIMPVYNAEATVKRAIASILSQSIKNLELIIINDGSTDRTLDVIQGIEDPRVKLLNLPHSGIVTALNEGLQHATSPYIARMDADDWSHPRRLEKQVAFLDLHPEIGLVSCLVGHCGDQVAQKGYSLYIDWLNQHIDHSSVLEGMLIESPIAHPSVLFRRQLIEQWGPYADGDFPEDYELWLRWASKSVLMQKIPEKLLEWSDPPNRLSRTDSRYSPEKFFLLKVPFLIETLKTHGISFPRTGIWGAGKLARRKARILTQSGLEIAFYVDIDPGKKGKLIAGSPVIAPSDLVHQKGLSLISLVSSRGAREQIQDYLASRGWTKNIDFFIA